MDKQQVFLNAAYEGADAHNFGDEFSILKTSYACPHCNRSKLIAEVYEQANQRTLKEVDVSCPTCSEKISLVY